MNTVRKLSPGGCGWEDFHDPDLGITGRYWFLISREEESGRIREAGFFEGQAVAAFDWQPPFDELIYVIDGSGRVVNDGGTTDLEPGDLVLFPKGSRSLVEFDGPWREAFAFIA